MMSKINHDKLYVLCMVKILNVEKESLCNCGFVSQILIYKHLQHKIECIDNL